MPRETTQPLEFPLAGVDTTTEFQLQPPGTCASAANVRGVDPLAELDRGGSRPGLSKFLAAQVSGNAPVQHLTVLVTSDREAMASDYVAADARSYPSQNPDAVSGTDYDTDPSTNNNAAGLGDRNPGRVVPEGGSGRRHLRQTTLQEGEGGGECVCRTYHVAAGFEESWQDFEICDDYEFPYDFTADAAIGWGGDPLVAPGPEAPTLSEVLALIEAAGGPAETEQYDDATDTPCAE